MNFRIKSSFSKPLNFCLLLNFNIIILLIRFFNLINEICERDTHNSSFQNFTVYHSESIVKKLFF